MVICVQQWPWPPLSFFTLSHNEVLLPFICSMHLSLPLWVLQQSESFHLLISCYVQIRSSLLLLTLLLCISMRSDCIVMLHRLQNTHFHLWLSLCGQSRDRLPDLRGAERALVLLLPQKWTFNNRKLLQGTSLHTYWLLVIS